MTSLTPSGAETLRYCEAAIRKDLHLFQAGGHHLAYGRVSGVLLDLNPAEAALLQDILDHPGPGAEGCGPDLLSETSRLDTYASTLRRVMERISRRRVIRADLAPIQALLVLVTDACNLACSYCYCRFGQAPRVGHMTDETARAVARAVHDLGIRRLSFFGGEPLLNFPAIQRFIETVSSLGLEIEYGMTTNATLVRKSIARYLERWGVRVSVSIDGPPEVHNLTRVYPNGEGSYDDVIRGIEILRAHGLLKLVEITHSARHPPDLGRTVAHLESLGCPVTCSCVDGPANAPYAREIVDGERLKRYYDELLPRVLGDATPTEGRPISGPAELVAAVLSPVTVHRAHICTGVTSRAAIAPDGRVYPCPETMGEEYGFGSVLEPDFARLMEERRRAALTRLIKGPVLEQHWFNNLVDTCVVRLERDSHGRFVLRGAKEVSDCLEHALGLIVSRAEASGLGGPWRE